MSKKKKHIQTEKERLHQEEAARKRAEKAERERMQNRRTALILLGIAMALFAVMAALVGDNIAKVRNYELHYTKTYGMVTAIRTHNSTGYRNDRHYYLIFSYTADGKTYSAEDWEGYNSSPDKMIGERIAIYVSKADPERAARVVTADGFSIMAAFACVLGAIPYVVGMATLLAVKKSSFKKRALAIWLPLFGLCAACVLLFWVGLPTEGFAAVFGRVRGAIGFTVLAGIALAFGTVDGLLSRKG